jgi:hypothetical protein
MKEIHNTALNNPAVFPENLMREMKKIDSQLTEILLAQNEISTDNHGFLLCKMLLFTFPIGNRNISCLKRGFFTGNIFQKFVIGLPFWTMTIQIVMRHIFMTG